MRKVITNFLFILFVVLVLVLTLRGISGNPTPQDILVSLRDPSKPFELSPERGRYALTMSIVENKSFHFSKEIARFVVPDLGTINGKYVSLFAPGVSFFAIPFYLLGSQLNLTQVVTFSLSSLFAVLNVILICFIVRKLTNNIYAGVVAGLTFIFATVAWTYAGTLYQHHITTFFLLITGYLLLSKTNLFKTSLIGLFLGFSFFVDYQNVIFFIPSLLLLLHKHLSVSERLNKITIKLNNSILFILVGIILSLAPLYIYNQLTYGNPLQLAGTVKRVKSVDEISDNIIESKTSTYKKKTTLGFFKAERIPQGLDVLITSKDRGILIFSPVILLGLLGLIPLLKINKPFGYSLIFTMLTFLALYSMWGDPWGGWAFGPRYMIPVFGLLAIPLGLAIDKYKNNVWFIIIYFLLLYYSVAVNLVGALTTNQIPPSVEYESIYYPKLTYLYNFDLLYDGTTGSFAYKTFFSTLLPLKYYAIIIYVSLIWIIAINYLLTVRKKS